MVLVRESEIPALEEGYISLVGGDGKEEKQKLRREFHEFLEPVSEKSHVYNLKQKPSTNKCPLLQSDGRCSVHRNKPLDCVMWPIMPGREIQPDESNPHLVHLDIDCPALGSGEFPATYFESLVSGLEHIVETDSDIEKQLQILYDENRKSYGQSRLATIGPLNSEHIADVLFEAGPLLKKINSLRKRYSKKLENKIDKIHKQYESVRLFEPNHILGIYKWFYGGFAFILLGSASRSFLTYLGQAGDSESDASALSVQISGSLSRLFGFEPTGSPLAGSFDNFGIALLFAAILFGLLAIDILRILAPLPFYTYEMSTRVGESEDAESKPRCDTSKKAETRLEGLDVFELGFLTLITYLFLLLFSCSYTNIFTYALCMVAIQLVDLLWYVPRNVFTSVVEHVLPPAERRATKKLDVLRKTVRKAPEKMTRKIDSRLRAFERQVEKRYQTGLPFKGLRNALSLRETLYWPKEIDKKIKDIEKEKKDIQRAIKQSRRIRADMRKESIQRNKYFLIAASDIVFLSVVVFSLAFSSEIIEYTGAPVLPALFAITGFVLHSGNIYWDLRENHVDYYRIVSGVLRSSGRKSSQNG